jgi:hypothetical protein
MTDTIIQRTYNRWGDRMYLIRMDNTPRGWCPVWSLDRRQAVTVTETYAADLLGHIAAWRDRTCPDGIAGVEAVCVA